MKAVNASDVSFGRVLAIYAKPKKMNQINKKLSPYVDNGKVMIKNVTSFYKHASTSGEMAQAAQRGEVVDIFITGDDINKIKKQQSGWRSMRDILVNIEDCINAGSMYISDVVSKILN